MKRQKKGKKKPVKLNDYQKITLLVHAIQLVMMAIQILVALGD